LQVTETIRNLPHPPDSDVPPARQNLHQEETLWPIGALYGPGEEITVDAIWAVSDPSPASLLCLGLARSLARRCCPAVRFHFRKWGNALHPRQ